MLQQTGTFLVAHWPVIAASAVGLCVALSHVLPPTTWYGTIISYVALNFGRPYQGQVKP